MSDIEKQKVVTRFAPSPTGFLHVGGARTAMFSWAYARANGGEFILRIEDTDKARSTPEATKAIIADMKWLGLDWDQGPAPGSCDSCHGDADWDPYAEQKGENGPYFQSQRGELYEAAIKKLFDMGRAYYCFKTAEELDAARKAARAAKKPYQYDPADMLALNADEDALKAKLDSGDKHVVRFKMPDHDVVVNDEILGEVVVKAAELEDFIIVKADGGPTFHLANVVDDAAMGVTLVMRAQEHLNNTPKHVALFEALGLKLPKFAHIPLIFNSDGSKMSKRDKGKAARAAAKDAKLESVEGIDDELFKGFMDKKNDEMVVSIAIAKQLGLALPEIDVADFRDSGYLPEVLNNYLALLGWSPGNDIERFGADPLTFIKDHFTLERVGKSAAKFDRDKLAKFNTEAVVMLEPEDFKARLKKHLETHYPEYGSILANEAHFDAFCKANQERSRSLDEPAKGGMFFVSDEVKYDFKPKNIKKAIMKNEGEGFVMLARLKDAFSELPEEGFGDAAHEWIAKTAEEEGLNMGKMAQPIRVAVSGGTVTPPIDATLNILGKAKTLARFEACIAAKPK
ncbi:glutamate--tRNA ligase [Poriferisphaera corsica]|nr:glutamate--tRNA ligase [Poriferisphaera corsica]